MKNLIFILSLGTFVFLQESVMANTDYDLCEPWKKCCEATLCGVDGPGHHDPVSCEKFCRDVRDACEQMAYILPTPPWATSEVRGVEPSQHPENKELPKKGIR